MIQQMSDSELTLMKIIWENGGTALYIQISKTLTDQGKEWKKNTIITLLSRLAEKGLLKTNKIGHKNKYIAVVSESDYQAAQTQNLMDKLFEGSVEGLVLTLLQKEMLSQNDWEKLNCFWKGGKD